MALNIRWSALFVALTAAGCAGPGARSAATPPGEGHLTLVTAGSANQLKFEGKNLFGPRLNVSFYADGYRGQYDHQQVVDLRPVGDDKIFGSVAGQPTDLSIEEGPSWLRVRGLYKGRVSSFVFTSRRLQGMIGDCSYSLSAYRGDPNTYFGGRACGVGGGGTRLTLPGAFEARPARERVLALALLLGAD
jgi:hypothetical protein